MRFVSVLIVLLSMLEGSSPASELVEIWKLDLDSQDRNHEAAACAFDGSDTLLLTRSSSHEFREVAFTTRRIDPRGAVREETVLAKWEPSKSVGVGLACGMFANVTDPATKAPGLIITGRFRPGGISTIQRFSDKGALEWTEPLPGGELTVYLDAVPFQDGYLLTGVSGTSGVAVAVDSIGQKRWAAVGKKRTKTSKAAPLKDGSVALLSHSFEKTGVDNSSRLTMCDSRGKVLHEVSLEGTAEKRRVNPLTGEIEDDSWLVGTLPGDRILVVKTLSPEGKQSELVGEIYDATLKRLETVDFSAVIEGWGAVHSVGALGESEIYIIGEHGKAITVASASLGGRLRSKLRAEPPPGAYGTKAWTDGRQRLCVFVDRVQKSARRDLIRFGTVYMFQASMP